MEEACFVDTSAWYAYSVPEDTHHAPAQAFLRDASRRLITTNYVMLETANLLHLRSGRGRAVEFLRQFRESRRLTTHHVTPGEHDDAERLFNESGGYSLTDCSSFVVMRSIGLRDCFTFDRDFARAGFSVVPEAPARTS